MVRRVLLMAMTVLLLLVLGCAAADQDAELGTRVVVSKDHSLTRERGVTFELGLSEKPGSSAGTLIARVRLDASEKPIELRRNAGALWVVEFRDDNGLVYSTLAAERAAGMDNSDSSSSELFEDTEREMEYQIPPLPKGRYSVVARTFAPELRTPAIGVEVR